MEEKRRAKRYTLSYPLEGNTVCDDYENSLLDLSTGGIAFRAKDDLRAGEEIELSLFLKKQMFLLKAAVVHVVRVRADLYVVGVEFLDPPSEFYEILEKEIQEVTQLHRESNLYEHKDITLRTASAEYLKKTPS